MFQHCPAAPAILVAPGDSGLGKGGAAEPLLELLAADVKRGGRGQVVVDHVVVVAEAKLG